MTCWYARAVRRLSPSATARPSGASPDSASLQQCRDALVRHHDGGHAVLARPRPGPAQRGPVRHLEHVRPQPGQQPGQPPPAPQHPVPAGERHPRRAQRDHPALRGRLVAVPLTRDDQHRLVPRGQVAGAQFGERGAQAARVRRDKVGQPDDPHSATFGPPGPQHRGVVPDQLLGQRGPATAQHLAPPGRAERRARRRVGGQPGHRGGECVRVRRRHQVPGHPVIYQVKRPSGGRRDHRQPARGGLLHCLPERLIRPAVHEHVQAGVDGRQLLAPALAEEDGVRHVLAQHGLGRPGPHDDQPDPGQRGDPGQHLDPLLGGQAADVAHEQLSVLCQQRRAQLLAALGRVEAPRVHAAAPQPDVADALAEQAGRGDRGRGQRARGAVVDAAQPPPGERLAGPAEPVRPRVGRQVGLVHRDRGQAEPPGHRGAVRAQEDRAGQVHHLGLVPDRARPGPGGWAGRAGSSGSRAAAPRARARRERERPPTCPCRAPLFSSPLRTPPARLAAGAR